MSMFNNMGDFPRNSNGGNQDDYQDSTKGITLYCAPESRFLELGFWNRTATVEIGTLPPGSDMSWENRKNAYKTRLNVSYADLCTLEDLCLDILDTIKSTGAFESTGMVVGARRNSVIEINNGDSIGRPTGIYLVIYKNVNQNLESNQLEYYTFSGADILKGYKYNTGEHRATTVNTADFKRFIKFVKEAGNAMTMATAHSVMAAQKNDRLALLSGVSMIAASMGVDFTARPDSATRFNSRNNNGGSYNNQYNSNQQYNRKSSPVVTIDDPVDISPVSMDDLTSVDMSEFA